MSWFPAHPPPILTRQPSISAFERTRHDHASETAEDYVEAIEKIIISKSCCRVTDLASEFGVSHVTALKNVRRLERDGLAITEPRMPISLTPKGKKLAKSCKERHQIVYDFLRSIGVSKRTAAIDSEGIEHHVSPETLTKMKSMTNR